MLRSMREGKLALLLYTVPPSGNPVVVDYSAQVEKISFTTVAPGGYGQFSADLRIPDMDQPHPELALFSRVALISPRKTVWLGEMVSPVYDTSKDEIYTISALGIGNALRDDPRRGISYANQTVAQVIAAEITARAAYWVLSTDTSKVSPGNPASTYSPSYDGRTLEEIVADQALLDGDDHWGVWAHANQVDAVAGLPLGQIQLHPRDLATVSYVCAQAFAEVQEQQLTPSADRAYNVVEIGYYDATQNPPVSSVTYTDPRLAGSGAQGTAPFRRRKYFRDLSGTTTVTKAQAQAIANAYGAVFQNITNTNTFTIGAAYDAQGDPVDLWDIAADHNVQINDLVYRINQQSIASQIPTTAVSGTNLFYIVQTTYAESSDGTTTVQLQTDNWLDTMDVRIARLQHWSDLEQRANKTTGTVQAAGAAEIGGAGAVLNAASAAQTMQVWVPFRAIMSTAPTSITLTAGSSSNITGSASATGITVNGFKLQWTATASGATNWFGTYKTNGN